MRKLKNMIYKDCMNSYTYSIVPQIDKLRYNPEYEPK